MVGIDLLHVPEVGTRRLPKGSKRRYLTSPCKAQRKTLLLHERRHARRVVVLRREASSEAASATQTDPAARGDEAKQQHVEEHKEPKKFRVVRGRHHHRDARERVRLCSQVRRVSSCLSAGERSARLLRRVAQAAPALARVAASAAVRHANRRAQQLNEPNTYGRGCVDASHTNAEARRRWRLASWRKRASMARKGR